MTTTILTPPCEAVKRDATSFKRILLATDFSEASEQALSYAVALCARYAGDLFLVHATEPEPRDAVPMDPLPRVLDREHIEAERKMKRLDRSAKLKGIPHHTMVERGRVWDVLSEVIERERIDLLVMGTHGRRGFKKLALGSVAEEVLCLAPCPTLTVGPNVPAAPMGPVEFREVLFTTDFGEASQRALPFAITVVQDSRGHLVLLHMEEPMPVADITPAAYGPPLYVAQELEKWQAARRSQSKERMADLLPEKIEWTSPPSFEVAMDLAADGILDAAKRHKADVIVMGTNHRDTPRLSAHLPFSLISEVIRKARCPVLTVRA
jgi:nucleotide-binding universal stress UspA family protein